MSKLTPANRDELLIRLDERTSNIWTLTEKQEKHLTELNNSVAKNTNRLNIIETKVDERTQSKISKKAVTGYGGIAVTVGTLLYYLGQANGWW